MEIERLKKIKASLNPITLEKVIEEKLKHIYNLFRQLEKKDEKKSRLPLRSDELSKAHSRGAKRRRNKNLTAA